jgi:flagellar hook assembly protein FlgD
MFHHDTRHTGLVGAQFITAVAPELPGVGLTDLTHIALASNAPNPWKNATTISFVVPTSVGRVAQAQLRVYDPAGRLVATLVNAPLAPGAHSVVWDGRTTTGRRAHNGTYFYRLDVGGQTITRQMVVLQ